MQSLHEILQKVLTQADLGLRHTEDCGDNRNMSAHEAGDDHTRVEVDLQQHAETFSYHVNRVSKALRLLQDTDGCIPGIEPCIQGIEIGA